jgi:hypothetical protein
MTPASQSQTLDDVISALNGAHGWTLPVAADFADGSEFRAIWELAGESSSAPPNTSWTASASFEIVPGLTGVFTLVVSLSSGSLMPDSAVSKTGDASVVFGIVLSVSGHSVPISTASLADAKENGVEFKLPQPVTLGTISEFEQWVSDKFGVSKPDAGSLPSPLDTVVKTVEDMQVTIQQCHVKVPGSKSSDQTTRYTLSVAGTFQSEIDLIPKTLSINGMVFGVSNELPTT